MTRRGVLVLSGPPCSGKSTVGRLLSADRTWLGSGTVHIEVDALFSLLLPTSDRGRADRMLGYDAAHALARIALERERHVVLECTYARAEQRVSLVDALEGTDAPLWVIEFSITPEQALRRFRLRDQTTDLDEKTLRDRVRAFPYSDFAFRLSAASAPNNRVDTVKAWMRQGPDAVPRTDWVAAGRSWD